MPEPGHLLRQVAVRLLPAAAVRRVVDPVIADWQAEYGEATSRSSWTRRWVRYSGYGILLRALLVYGCWQLSTSWRGWSPDERGSLGRMFAITAAATVMLVVLLAYEPFVDTAAQVNAMTAAFLIPQAVPIAAPLGLLLGILFTFRRGPSSRRVAGVAIVAAVAVSVGSFLLLSQVVPAANQAFRLEAFRLTRRGADTSRVARGLAEMTLTELGQQVDEARRGGQHTERVRRIDFHLQQRRALAVAPLPLAAFALVVGTRRRYGLLGLGVAGAGITALYYTLMIASDRLSVVGMEPVLVVWLPHLGVSAISAPLLLLSRPRRQAPVPSDLV